MSGNPPPRCVASASAPRLPCAHRMAPPWTRLSSVVLAARPTTPALVQAQFPSRRRRRRRRIRRPVRPVGSAHRNPGNRRIAGTSGKRSVARLTRRTRRSDATTAPTRRPRLGNTNTRGSRRRSSTSSPTASENDADLDGSRDSRKQHQLRRSRSADSSPQESPDELDEVSGAVGSAASLPHHAPARRGKAVGMSAIKEELSTGNRVASPGFAAIPTMKLSASSDPDAGGATADSLAGAQDSAGSNSGRLSAPRGAKATGGDRPPLRKGSASRPSPTRGAAAAGATAAEGGQARTAGWSPRL